MAVFWIVAPCSLVGDHRPDDGGSKHLWNVGKLLSDYTVLQPRRQPSSYSPPWEPQILLCWVPWCELSGVPLSSLTPCIHKSSGKAKVKRSYSVGETWQNTRPGQWALIAITDIPRLEPQQEHVMLLHCTSFCIKWN
jgi:hypothetical protein